MRSLRQLGSLNKQDPSTLDNIPNIKKSVFPNGKAGNFATVYTMTEIARKYSADPIVRQLAINILNHYNTDSHNHLDEAFAIGDYIKEKIKYTYDPSAVEYITEPTLMIKNIQNGTARGDCDDIALMIATLLLSVGIEPYFVIVKYDKKSNSYGHIYVCVYETNYRDEKKSRLVLDGIIKDKKIGYEVAHFEKKEFKV